MKNKYQTYQSEPSYKDIDIRRYDPQGIFEANNNQPMTGAGNFDLGEAFYKARYDDKGNFYNPKQVPGASSLKTNAGAVQLFNVNNKSLSNAYPYPSISDLIKINNESSSYGHSERLGMRDLLNNYMPVSNKEIERPNYYRKSNNPNDAKLEELQALLNNAPAYQKYLTNQNTIVKNWSERKPCDYYSPGGGGNCSDFIKNIFPKNSAYGYITEVPKYTKSDKIAKLNQTASEQLKKAYLNYKEPPKQLQHQQQSFNQFIPIVQPYSMGWNDEMKKAEAMSSQERKNEAEYWSEADKYLNRDTGKYDKFESNSLFNSLNQGVGGYNNQPSSYNPGNQSDISNFNNLLISSYPLPRGGQQPQGFNSLQPQMNQPIVNMYEPSSGCTSSYPNLFEEPQKDWFKTDFSKRELSKEQLDRLDADFRKNHWEGKREPHWLESYQSPYNTSSNTSNIFNNYNSGNLNDKQTPTKPFAYGGRVTKSRKLGLSYYLDNGLHKYEYKKSGRVTNPIIQMMTQQRSDNPLIQMMREKRSSNPLINRFLGYDNDEEN